MGEQYQIIQIDDSTWSIEDGFVRFFLLKGDEKALLIDSGVDIDGVKELASGILKEAGADGLLIELLNTHGDGDHCHGNQEFDWFYMHEADWDLYRSQFPDDIQIRPVKDGDIIDLGDRPLEIIHIPGHTYGSIAILDVNRRMLFSGDSVQNGDIFMFGNHRNLDEYPASLLKLQELDERFDAVYASHAQLKLEPDHIGECFDACESMMHGEVEPSEEERHGVIINAYDCGACTFLVGKDRIFESDEDDD